MTDWLATAALIFAAVVGIAGFAWWVYGQVFFAGVG